MTFNQYNNTHLLVWNQCRLIPKNEDENLVSYCGLYCGDCYNYTGSIADMTRDLRKELKKNKFTEIAKVMPFKEFNNYQECYECLSAMEYLRCEGCKDG